MRAETPFPIRMAPALAILLAIGCAGTMRGLAQGSLSAEASKVLERMDARSRTLSTLTADLKQTKWTKVIDEVSEKTGKLSYKRSSRKSTFKVDYHAPDLRTLLLEKGKVRIWEPRIKRYQEIDTGNGSATTELPLFWIGRSGRSIRRDYDIRHIKTDQVDGQPTSLLELNPGSTAVKNLFSRIRLWVDHTHWIPIQTRFFEASEDSHTILLSNIKINPRLPNRIFELQVPSDFERVEQKLPPSR